MEEVIENMLGFGRFQKCVTVLIGSTSILSAMAVYSTVFTDAYPNKPSSDNLCVSNDTNVSCESLANQTQACLYESIFGLTSSIEWKLACAHVSYSYLLQTFYMIGSMCSLLVGYMSDRFGRRRVSLTLLALISITMSTSQLLISTIDISVPFKYTIYSISKFSLGILCVGLFSVTYVLLFEIVSHKHITLVSNLNVYLFVLGELIITVVSYVFQSWHVINWFIAAYSFTIFLIACYFLPESPRYLIVHKRYDELYVRLKYIARVNGSERYFDTMNENEVIDSLLKNLNGKNDENSNGNETVKNKSILSYIVKSKRHLFIRVVYLSYIWFSLQLVYFGIGLGVTNIDNVNPYLMFTISSIAEFIGYLLCHFNDRFRRKVVFSWVLGLASLMCLFVSILQSTMLNNNSDADSNLKQEKIIVLIVLISIGKAMSSAAFNCAYMYTSLMFGTCARNTLLVFVSSAGRVGAIVAPMINMVGNLVWKQLPYVLFSLFSLIGTIFIITLPDPSKINEF